MAIENISTEALNQFIVELGKMGQWIQAIGILIILWLIFQAISLANNAIKRKKLIAIESRLLSIEKKLDKVLNKK